MVLPTCFISIPALPDIVTVSTYPVQPLFAYAPTNTNYFGGTSCGLSSLVTPTLYSLPTQTVKCTLPASVSGKAYSVTPVIWVPRTVSKSVYVNNPYTCDPIPAASINKGNFKFACKSLLGKDMGKGDHTISWKLPTAAGSIRPFTFYACPPTSTPKYVVNTALAKTTLVPTTHAYVTTTSTMTVGSTTTVTVPTRTSTCFYTVTVAPPLGPHVRRAGGADVQPSSDTELPASDSVVVDVDAGHNLAHVSHGTDNSTDIVMDLKERAASATPTIGKPDFTYPPYGVTTIYVKSISTSLWTYMKVSTFHKTGPAVTTTASVVVWTTSTVMVTGTPVSR
ncbi:hypothetical protein C8A01DRAFT_21577 [Parachaetomium inaequale]|uniref:Uncharacterized protein n=1 Tax=Parachaetomium inaequale TaxID=2588326 RepID=A0AAN6P3P4_9PEZI|nr:hypothetical protein C8A01DRAFT_21577 [Parachaetomium inaequale]